MILNIIFGIIALLFFMWLALALWVGFQSVFYQDEATSQWHKDHPDAHMLRGHGGRGY